VNEHHPSGDAHGGAHAFSLGVERLGLVPLHFRWLVLSFVLLISVLAALGIGRIKVDDSLSELFRADTPEFKQYATLSSRFPSSEYDVLIVVEGKSLLERGSVDALRNTVIELQFVDGMQGLISLFSAREPPEPGKLPAPLFPETLPEGAEYDQLIQTVTSNRIIAGKLLSQDGELALVVLALDKAVMQGDKLQTTVT